jgi:CheY-like chemotaxis protein
MPAAVNRGWFIRAQAARASSREAGYTSKPGGLILAEAKKNGRILVVDDEETVGIGMSEILKDEGFEAAYVVSGRDAVQAVKETQFNLVFMDIVMPGMNGLDTFREIRKHRPNTRVVLFTGYFRDAEDVILQGIKEGMIDEFIRKPYFADEIIRSARKYAVA